MRQDQRSFTRYEADTEEEGEDVSAGYPGSGWSEGPQEVLFATEITYRSRGTSSQRRFDVQQGAPPHVRQASLQQPTATRARETEEHRPRRRFHPLVFVSIALFIMVAGWVVFTSLATWWTNTQEQWQYGYPRTAHYDVAVGHNDSPTQPSHFIALNLKGQVEIIEFPGGDAAHAQIYTGLSVIGQNASLIPVTLSFQDMNGDGTLDMIVTVGNTHYLFLNKKGQFLKPQSQ